MFLKVQIPALLCSSVTVGNSLYSLIPSLSDYEVTWHEFLFQRVIKITKWIMGLYASKGRQAYRIVIVNFGYTMINLNDKFWICLLASFRFPAWSKWGQILQSHEHTEWLDYSVVGGERLHKSQWEEKKKAVPNKAWQKSWLSLFKSPVAGNTSAVLEEIAGSSEWKG